MNAIGMAMEPKLNFLLLTVNRLLKQIPPLYFIFCQCFRKYSWLYVSVLTLNGELFAI
jgi:hypothetical protein